MSSSTKPEPAEPTNWILTTCRGRAAHLRTTLVSWLEHMPGWAPLVVCCDDEEAFEYAGGELALAGRGAAILTHQGPYFSRLEAIRLGVYALGEGIEDGGFSFRIDLPPKGEPIPTPPLRGRVIIFDADCIATARTQTAVSNVDPYAVGVAAGRNRDDLGFLITGANVLQYAVAQIERDAFNGYGYEDSAIRVGCWHATAGAFVQVPPCWARINHSDAERLAHYEKPMKVSGVANAEALARLVKHLIDVDRWQDCCETCIPSQRFHLKIPGVA